MPTTIILPEQHTNVFNARKETTGWVLGAAHDESLSSLTSFERYGK